MVIEIDRIERVLTDSMTGINVHSAIAGEIMTPYVIMIEKNASFRELVQILTEKNISAVFIFDEENEDYFIVSQTDVVNFLGNGGLKEKELGEVPVSEIMNGPIDMLHITTPIDKIIRFMATHNYKRALISENQRAVGVISTRDIMIWNDTYFKPASPHILLFLDNITSLIIAKHVFEDNLTGEVRHELIEAYGGALKAINVMTEEILKNSGDMKHMVNDKTSILFEPYNNITGILICDYNSIDLRKKLQKATHEFYDVHKNVMTSPQSRYGINIMLKIQPVIHHFK